MKRSSEIRSSENETFDQVKNDNFDRVKFDQLNLCRAIPKIRYFLFLSLEFTPAPNLTVVRCAGTVATAATTCTRTCARSTRSRSRTWRPTSSSSRKTSRTRTKSSTTLFKRKTWKQPWPSSKVPKRTLLNFSQFESQKYVCFELSAKIEQSL